jgi:hypothetical protein
MTEVQKTDQIEKNYKAFLAKLPELMTTHAGKFALLHDEEVVEFFDTARDAFSAGQKLYPGNDFSVQKVTTASFDLGFFSRALH